MDRLLFQLFLVVFLSNCFSLANSNYTAIFTFGDSYTAAGNITNLIHYSPTALDISTLPSIINSPPYGMTFFGHPTGRCSDGRVIIDFIAEAFGVPLLPPFFSDTESFRQGVNFAVIGSTALNMSFFHRRGLSLFIPDFGISMGDQIGWFEGLKPSLCKTVQECRDYFGKSLFVLGEFGVNDQNFAIFEGLISLDEIRSYVPEVVKAIRLATERLIKQGAVNILVPGIPPTGCLPIFLSMKSSSTKKEDYDPRTGCLWKLNDLAEYHNRLLRVELLQLQNKYKNKRIMYGDFYGAAIRMVHSPKHFGFSNGGLRACCGKQGPYNFNLIAWCGQSGSTTCKDPSTYVNWDGAHYTDAASQYIATAMLKGHGDIYAN